MRLNNYRFEARDHNSVYVIGQTHTDATIGRYVDQVKSGCVVTDHQEVFELGDRDPSNWAQPLQVARPTFYRRLFGMGLV